MAQQSTRTNQMQQKGIVVWLPALGRKRPLAKTLQDSLRSIVGAESRLLASDSSDHSDHADVVDFWMHSPETTDEIFISWAQDFCSQHRVDWIIPTRDAEMRHWARWNETRVLGEVRILVSSLDLVEVWSRKSSSASWLEDHGLTHPGWTRDASFFPKGVGLIAKPDEGYGSQGVVFADGEVEIRDLWNDLPLGYGVQRTIRGTEYTINLYFDPKGVCRAIIPHARLEVSEGEVSHGITVDDEDLLALGSKLAAATGGRAKGPLNFQAIRCAETESLYITDINPRFGGGYPLTHKAGGRFTDWICEEFFLGRLASDYSWEARVEFERNPQT